MAMPRWHIDLDGPERRRLTVIAATVLGLHALGFTLLLLASHRAATAATFGFGTGLLAYSLGVRHAFDADHITAIDTTTRVMMARGKRPLAVGFFFSLGHSSVVFVLTVLMNLGLRALYGQVRDGASPLHHYTDLIGSTVSGGFLLLIGLLNAIVLAGIVKAVRGPSGGRLDHAELDRRLARRGLLNRVFGRLTAGVDASWKMFPIGILFGLGFDTATEIGLLVLAGTSVPAGLPIWAIVSLPILFAAGMSLFDTIDGSFMNVVYGWAMSIPARKVFYNVTITAVSVAVALLVGGLQLAHVASTELRLTGGVWDYVNHVDLNQAGLLIVGLFLAVWAGALSVWRLGRFEQRWSIAARPAVPELDGDAVRSAVPR